jgi:transmembrane sensor
VTGGGRFQVARAPDRRFRVVAGGVAVEVRGTVFEVHRAGVRAEVRVAEGRVAVSWPGGEAELGAGGRGLFPPPEAPPPPAAVPAARTPAPVSAPGPRRASSWRTLAARRSYAQAYEALAQAGAGAVKDAPADLLLAADVARLGDHPAAAVPPLHRILTRFADDARAPLAAFTLGRVLLDDLGRPREAAEIFARARDLGPRGALAEHALAREVEAWRRAGEPARARARALDYERRYPDGARLRSVRRLGGLPTGREGARTEPR